MSSVGKVQIIHAQVDINQLQAEAHALRDHSMRQTTVTPSPEGEKLRMQRRRKKDHGKEKKGYEGDKEDGPEEGEPSAPPGKYGKINIKV